MSAPPTTKSGRLQAARALIDSHGFDQVWSSAAVRELAALTGTPLRAVIKKRNAKFPNDLRHLHVLAYDWTTPQQWSWNKAIEFEGRDEARIRRKQLDALRDAVRADLADFLAAAVQACAGEGCRAMHDLTVDHVAPPFIEIAEAFLAERGPLALVATDGGCDVIAEDAVLAEWVAFHAARSTYQVLCRSCNARKGARGVAA